MRLLEHSFDSPAQNLALDEAVLDAAEAGECGEVLRFWESAAPFVVLGLSQELEAHVHREACAVDGVPILRRCSAGGCVLQAPGCLNYSLILRVDNPDCGTIHSSYSTILQSISRALRELGCECSPAGISDLAAGPYKVSGSAQRRRKHFFLHHGTLLYAMDLELCSRYLKEPEDRPEYRSSRAHVEFLRNLPLERKQLVLSVSEVFRARDSGPLNAGLSTRVEALIADKYSRPSWNARK